MTQSKLQFPRPFILLRHKDLTGVSGTGIVAEGALFSNGKATVVWRGPLSSVEVHDSLETVIKIHGHDGATVVRFTDETL